METILIKSSSSGNGKRTNDIHTAVRLKNYVLASGCGVSLLIGTDWDAKSVVKKLEDFQFQIISSPESQPHGYSVRDKIRCIAAFVCDFIPFTLDGDLRNVALGEQTEADQLPNKTYGLFLLFSTDSTNVEEGVRLFFDRLLPLNRSMIGSPVTVVSTPFQNLFMLNTISKGVICNILGKNQCFFLTDAKLSMGCEGAPIFSIYGDLIGLTLSIFAWCKGEWMGFSLAAHLFPVLKAWLESLPVNGILEKRIPNYAFVEDVERFGVVVISSPRGWGSGIIIDKNSGLIVTCSHVVHYSTKVNIQVEYRKNVYNAKTIYASPINSPFDVAVIKVTSSNFRNVSEFKIPSRAIAKGEPIYVIGYSLFSLENHSIDGPCVSYGSVANVYGNGGNTMMICTCVANSGCSGGAVVRPNGELVGLVTSNFSSNEVIMPQLVAAIPAEIFLKPVQKFLKSGDAEELNGLTSEDPEVRRIWRLETKCKL